MAVEVLKSRGVPEDHILFLNLIASPEGVKNFATKFPRLKVVTAFIDEVSLFPHFITPLLPASNTGLQGLDDKKYGSQDTPRNVLIRIQLHRTWPRRFWGQILHHLRQGQSRSDEESHGNGLVSSSRAWSGLIILVCKARDICAQFKSPRRLPQRHPLRIVAGHRHHHRRQWLCVSANVSKLAV